MKNPIPSDKPIFTIGAVAEMIGVSARMLRIYEQRGLIQPYRSIGNRRFYSLNEVHLLQYIQYLVAVKRVNLAGVRSILALLEYFTDAQREKFFQQVDKEIDDLQAEQKKVFASGEDSVSTSFFMR